MEYGPSLQRLSGSLCSVMFPVSYIYNSMDRELMMGYREDLWYCVRKSVVAEQYVKLVQDTTVWCETVLRCAIRVGDGFEVGGITSAIGSEPLVICNGNEQVD